MPLKLKCKSYNFDFTDDEWADMIEATPVKKTKTVSLGKQTPQDEVISNRQAPINKIDVPETAVFISVEKSSSHDGELKKSKGTLSNSEQQQVPLDIPVRNDDESTHSIPVIAETIDLFDENIVSVRRNRSSLSVNAVSKSGSIKATPVAQIKVSKKSSKILPKKTRKTVLTIVSIKGKCPHGRQKYYCRDCGGSGICEHDRRKELCKHCGGTQVCIHGRNKNLCKDCGGSKICIHDKQRFRCRACGGSAICVHNRIKYVCKECKATSEVDSAIKLKSCQRRKKSVR